MSPGVTPALRLDLTDLDNFAAGFPRALFAVHPLVFPHADDLDLRRNPSE
jgi:hypothetical protein